MKSRTEVLRIAESYLGDGGAVFRKFAGLPAGASYCNAYVDYVANKGGVSSLYFNGKKETYCPHSIEWCKKNLAQVPLYWGLPVDIIYFDWEPNGRPNHIGLVREKKSSTVIYTVEGNTDKKNKDGKVVAHNVVANRTRNGSYVQGVFHVQYVPAGVKKKKLDPDGEFGPQTIFNLQLALGMKPTGIFTKETAKALQRKVGATPDAVIGPGTARKLQKFLGCKQDGEIGPNTTKKLQKWINKVNYKSAAKKPAQTKPVATVKLTNAQKMLKKAKELAWAYGTATKKYDYKTGNPKAVCKTAMKKYGWADDRAEMSDCGNALSTIVRESGVDKSFKALHGIKTPFPTSEKAFNIVHKGEIKNFKLKPGDLVRYKKTNGKQHALMIFDDGKVCEASHHNFFLVIRKDTKRYNSQAKKSTIQVLRAKE